MSIVQQAESQALKKYARLLEELHGTRLHGLPERILPAPAEELREIIKHRIAQSNSESENERLLKMLSYLDLFATGLVSQEYARLLRGNLIAVPVLVATMYSIWQGILHGSWFWLAAPVALGVGAFYSLAFRMISPARGGLWNAVALEACRWVMLLGYGAVWLSLLFYSALGGLYRSWVAGPDVLGLLMATVSLVVCWKYSGYVNRLHYFVFANEYKGTKAP
ncbi:MAG: hypothetical protein M1358_26050 [Chloroflexi bacterium]|nr:hypothetical protein [Chloroflexota bacterium]